jgi:hypothetical protein
MGLAGCGVSPTEPDIVDQLVGEWLWIDATDGIAGVTLTPTSEGYDQSLLFTGSGEVELFRDGVSQARTQFTYFVGDDGGSDNIGYSEGLFGFPSSLVDLIPGDTLLLIDPCCDGFVRRWIRFPLGD